MNVGRTSGSANGPRRTPHCSCGADVFANNHRHGLHYDNDSSQLCAQSHKLTRDGWEELIIDALVEESLMITYQSHSIASKHQNATTRFVDSFFARWKKLLNNELPELNFEPKQWVDFINEPPSTTEPKMPQHPKRTAAG